MKSRNFKKLIDNDGKEYYFSSKNFSVEIKEFQNRKREIGERVTLQGIYEQLADKLYVTEESIKKWKQGYNGLADIEKVKTIASILGISYKNLLISADETKGQNVSIEKSIDMAFGDNEKEVTISILRDLQALVNSFDVTTGYTQLPYNENVDNGVDVYSYLFSWQNKIGLKLRQSRYAISEDTYNKIEQLYLETCGFVSPTMGQVSRWVEINKVWKIFGALDFEDENLVSEWGRIIDINDELYDVDEDVIRYLHSELRDYIHGFVADDTTYVLGLKIGDWYLDIIKHDFPELFD